MLPLLRRRAVHTGIMVREDCLGVDRCLGALCRAGRMDKSDCYRTNYFKFVIRVGRRLITGDGKGVLRSATAGHPEWIARPSFAVSLLSEGNLRQP